MTNPARGSAEVEILSAATILNTSFRLSSYGRGYDKRAVDAFMQQVASAIHGLAQERADAETEVHRLTAEVDRLQQRIIEGPRDEDLVHTVSIISNAQRTADATVAEADSYSVRVMSEARAAYEEARNRAAQLEIDAEQTVRNLREAAALHQEELDKQTAYLRTLRDATRTQMQKFLEGMLDHVAEQYGRAHPFAAEAATTKHPMCEAQSVDESGIKGEHAESHSSNGYIESPRDFVSAD